MRRRKRYFSPAKALNYTTSDNRYQPRYHSYSLAPVTYSACAAGSCGGIDRSVRIRRGRTRRRGGPAAQAGDHRSDAADRTRRGLLGPRGSDRHRHCSRSPLPQCHCRRSGSLRRPVSRTERPGQLRELPDQGSRRPWDARDAQGHGDVLVPNACRAPADRPLAAESGERAASRSPMRAAWPSLGSPAPCRVSPRRRPPHARPRAGGGRSQPLP